MGKKKKCYRAKVQARILSLYSGSFEAEMISR